MPQNQQGPTKTLFPGGVVVGQRVDDAGSTFKANQVNHEDQIHPQLSPVEVGHETTEKQHETEKKAAVQ